MRRGLLLIAALACFGAALALVSAAGLPGNSTLTGVDSDLADWTAPQIGSPAPPLRAALLDGGEIDLAALRGAPVLINFWATWCEPCAVEMPDLQRIADDTPAQVLAVNLAEPPDVMRAWLAERGLTLAVALDDLHMHAHRVARLDLRDVRVVGAVRRLKTSDQFIHNVVSAG